MPNSYLLLSYCTNRVCLPFSDAGPCRTPSGYCVSLQLLHLQALLAANAVLSHGVPRVKAWMALLLPSLLDFPAFFQTQVLQHCRTLFFLLVPVMRPLSLFPGFFLASASKVFPSKPYMATSRKSHNSGVSSHHVCFLIFSCLSFPLKACAYMHVCSSQGRPIHPPTIFSVRQDFSVKTQPCDSATLISFLETPG